MGKNKVVCISVDEKWFNQVFEKNRRALQGKLNKSRLSQRDFTAIDLKARKLLRGVMKETGL